MQAYDSAIEIQMCSFYESLSEKDRRRYAAVNKHVEGLILTFAEQGKHIVKLNLIVILPYENHIVKNSSNQKIKN